MGFIEIVEAQEEFKLDIGDSFFNLRRFDSEVYRRIEKKHTIKKKNLRGGQMIVDTDDYAVNADLLDYMITGWGGIKSSLTGEDVTCEKVNKLKLPGSVKMQITEACDAGSVTVEQGKGESGITS